MCSMQRDKKGRFKDVLGLDCTEDAKPSKYQERWRKKNPDLCPRCTKRKKAPNLGRCAECAIGEEGAAELRTQHPDYVKAMYPFDGPRRDHSRAVKKMFRARRSAKRS